MMMVDAELVAAKLAELDHRRERIFQHTPDSAEALSQQEDTLDLLSFNLMLAIQACLDVASHLIADKGWQPTSTLAESIGRLQEHGVIDLETCRELQQAVGLRNLVAHVYARVDPAKLYDAALRAPSTFEGFSEQLSCWVGRQEEL